MTRQELELLCQPQTPEEVLDGLKELYEERINLQGGAGDELLDALNSGYNILQKLIDDIDMPATVQVRRSIW